MLVIRKKMQSAKWNYAEMQSTSFIIITECDPMSSYDHN